MAVKNLYFTFYDKVIVGESRELQWGRNNLGNFSITFEGMKINYMMLMGDMSLT